MTDAAPPDAGRLAEGAGREDIVWLYQTVLGRAPENEAVIQARVGQPARAIIADFLNSEEYRRRAWSAATEHFARHPPTGSVTLDATPDQRDRLIAHARQTWEALGRDDAFWSVMTDDAYRVTALDPTARAAFFATGQDDVEVFLNACAAAGVDPRLEGRVVDFGCGVGRLGLHLARRYGAYLGVDISPPHLGAARSTLIEAGLSPRAEFQLLSDWLDGDDRWDAVFCVIVLQHNAPPVIAEMVRVLLDRLNTGGVAWIQIPHALYDYAYSAREHLAAIDAGHDGRMEMHSLPQHDMFRLIEQSGCRVRAAIADGRAGLAGLSTGYLIVKSE